jgi:hypothetical protein
MLLLVRGAALGALLRQDCRVLAKLSEHLRIAVGRAEDGKKLIKSLSIFRQVQHAHA